MRPQVFLHYLLLDFHVARPLNWYQSSNLATHVKVVHMGAKDYKCTFEGCGRSFGYKHTRDMHEKRRHSYIHVKKLFVCDCIYI